MSYDKIYGSLLGMAMGDSAGFAAMYHRALVLPPKRRNRLWSFSQITDRHRINKISLPFTHAMSEEILDFCGTDDTEFAIVAAQMILDCGNEITEEKLLHGWMQYIVKAEQEIWSGVSERASIENIKKGILPRQLAMTIRITMMMALFRVRFQSDLFIKISQKKLQAQHKKWLLSQMLKMVYMQLRQWPPV
ncbi:hypothetical protein C1N70_22975 [Cytobacillus firmus]